jgi:hypothetical protein
MTDAVIQPAPSRADQPDLDWSQVRETVALLNLAVAQIGWAMRDGDDSVNTLTESFTSMVNHAQTIREAGEALADGNEKATITNHCDAILQQMNHSIVAFQFYDKLSQRLAHVGNSLEELSQLVRDPGRLYNPYEWNGLQRLIRSKYTSEEDQAMFDAVIRGASVDEAMQLVLTQQGDGSDDDIELF